MRTPRPINLVIPPEAVVRNAADAASQVVAFPPENRGSDVNQNLIQRVKRDRFGTVFAKGSSLRLQDIANELDVSVSLVSKVLNGRLGTTGASAETVKNINRLARRMNYRKNAGAAALATGRQNAIGLFMHRMGVEGSAVSDGLIRGVSDRLRHEGIRLMLNFFQTFEEFTAFRPQVGPHALDGLIMAGISHTELVAELKMIHDAGVAVVTLHDRPVDNSFVNVGTNQEAVGFLATSHLISQGCRRIAHIHVDPYRAIGYMRALADGVPYAPELVIPVKNYQVDTGRDAVRQLCDAGIAFDGLVAQSDNQAAGAIYELLSRGLRVPQDVKVTGVDNSPICDLAYVPITSVSCERVLQSTTAVDCLLDLLSNRPVESTSIEPQLVVRASSSK